LAVAGAATGFWLMRTAGHGWAATWYLSVLLLFGSVLILVQDWQVFSAPKTTDRSWKFLRMAYVWLLFSLSMLVFLPVYQQVLLPVLAPESPAARLGFSHAYYGAARHAITVGFISLMIVGVAAKVVPTLNGVDVRQLSQLWGPFLLINTGCLLRVTGQILTDFSLAAFPVTAVSGLLEVAGLAWWGTHLWLVMSGRYSGRVGGKAGPSDSAPLMAGQPIQASHRVGEILDRYPQLLDTFLTFGFTPLRNPFFRRLVARNVTIVQAGQTLGIDTGELLEALNIALALQEDNRVPLPVLASESNWNEGTDSSPPTNKSQQPQVR
jgi:hypothetical protein